MVRCVTIHKSVSDPNVRTSKERDRLQRMETTSGLASKVYN